MGGDRSEWLADRRRLRRLAEGDRSALAEIYDAHASRLYRHALWLLGSRQEAEDVVHNVMIRIAGMGGELLGIRKARPYLMQMAHREAIDLIESRGRCEGEPFDPWPSLEGPDAVRAAEAAEACRLLAGIDPAQREVVYLHLFEGLTFREIGRVTGASMFTAASRYRLAIERLRREMRLP